MSKKILVSGASIAGPTLAFWLSRYGFEVTVVERAPSLRLGGQNIDITGHAQTIVQKMGVEEAILEANTGERGLLFVNKFNNVKAAFPKDSSATFTRELEILRGDLVEILYEHTKSDVTYLFDDFITDLKENESDMTVTFESGEVENFSLVIAADGFRSKARQLVFGDEVKFNFLNLYMAYLTIPKAPTDVQWARWYNAPGGKVTLIRPDNKGTTRACFAFWSDDEKYSHLNRAQQKEVLREKLQNAGWETPRIAKSIDGGSEEVYFDTISQVKAPHWSKGRFAMVGDAAYCPTPLTGMGTSLAIIGAYVLAGELARHEDHKQAFDAYEKLMRPYVESIQQLPPGSPRLVYPKSKVGVVLLNRIAGIAASRPAKKLFKYLGSHKKEDEGKDEDFVLPDYPALCKA